MLCTNAEGDNMRLKRKIDEYLIEWKKSKNKMPLIVKDARQIGKIDYIMHSLDFEEYLWAKGYSNEQIKDLYQCMAKNEPLSKMQYDVMMENF